MATDNELAGRAAGGDRLAYRDLVERYQTVVFGYCYYLTRGIEEARRLARETMVRGFVDAESRRQAESWVEFIERTAGTLHRQGRRLKSTSIVTAPDDTVKPGSGRPGDLSDKVLLAIAEDLHAIDASERVALTLRHAARMTSEEIAEVGGETEAAISSRTARGFKSLRDLLLVRIREGGISVGI